MKEGGWGGMEGRWRGDRVEWREGGRGRGTTHLGSLLPMSVHVRSPSFVSRGGRCSWWWFVRIMVRGSWVMVEGARRRFWDCDGGGSLLLGFRRHLWAASPVAINGRWASLVGGGGWWWSSPFSWAVRVVTVK